MIHEIYINTRYYVACNELGDIYIGKIIYNTFLIYLFDADPEKQ